jgi:hypothetical protein
VALQACVVPDDSTIDGIAVSRSAILIRPRITAGIGDSKLEPQVMR